MAAAVKAGLLLGAVLLALVFANLGRALPRTGGPYAYAKRAFGDFVGFQTAWGYWIAVWAGNAAIAVAFVSYLTVFWPAVGDDALVDPQVLKACTVTTSDSEHMARRIGRFKPVSQVSR